MLRMDENREGEAEGRKKGREGRRAKEGGEERGGFI